MTQNAETAAPKAKKTATAKKEKAPRGPTKMDQAREIFTSMAGSERKDIVAAFQEKVGLSAAASATYYQNIKSANAKASA